MVGTMTTRKMRAKPSARKYQGELAEPIYLPRGVSLADLGKPEKQQIDEDVARIKAARIARIGLLFEHYGIDPKGEHAWPALTFALAIDHVPGMDFMIGEKPRPGRTKTWQNGLGFELICAVETIRKAAGRPITISNAIELLQKEQKQTWGTYTRNNLITRHREAKRKFRKFEEIQNLFEKYMRQQSTMSPTLPIMGSVQSQGTSLSPPQAMGGLMFLGRLLSENAAEPETDEK
jgi:hypothetical protein